MTAASKALTGLVLAGGAGRRMGGQDKGLLPLHGRPLAAHMLDWLRPHVHALLISANRNLDTYRAMGATVCTDPPAHVGAGPLAGMLAGLRAARTPWLLAVPCDTPLLPPDLPTRLAAAQRAAGARVVIARTAGQIQPTVALIDTALADDLDAWLAGDERRVIAWMRRHPLAYVDLPDPAPFANLNTPDDLARLEATR